MAKTTIILAIDSAETRLLESYSATGQLPFLGQFLKNLRVVEGPHHFCEMGAWTTFWSGVPAVKHGYHCIRRLVPGQYGLELSNRPLQPCPPFWASLPGSVSIWDAQECHPDPALTGEQLCNWRTSFSERCPPAPASNPEALLTDVLKRHGEASRPVPVNLRDTPRLREKYFRLSMERVATCGRVLREAIARGDRDLYVFGCAELHSAGHLWWTHDEDGARRMLRLYQELDRELESVWRLAPAGSQILAVSAYGIYENFPCADVAEQILRGLGYQQSPAEGRRSVKSLLPLGVRRKIGEYLPIEAQERLINAGLHGNTDWTKSVAFGLPELYMGYIRINLRGREPQGVVEPGREYEELVARIADDFALLESPAPAIIRRIFELTGEAPRYLPDIIVTWQERDTAWEEVVHPRYRAPIARHQFNRNTYHSHRGFVAALDGSTLEGMPAVVDIPDVAGHLRRICG